MLCILGKTCAGKDTVLKELVKLGMKPVVSYTTRPMREGETEGVEYHFISNDEFIRKDCEGFFAETTCYSIELGRLWYYGCAKEDLGDDKVMIVNPHGLKKLMELEELSICSVCLSASEETIRKRLALRGDDEKEAERRIQADNRDFEEIEKDGRLYNVEGKTPEDIAKDIFCGYNGISKYGEKRNIIFT